MGGEVFRLTGALDVARAWEVNWCYALDKAEADKTFLAPRKGTGREGCD
jgi:hypothetical protein